MEQQGKRTARRVGLDTDKVADKAVALTKEMGLQGWSVRDLAKRLDVVPSVLYHYYPTKEDLAQAVTERVCALIQQPDLTLDWKGWFFQLAVNARAVFLEYHGIAERLMMGRFSSNLTPVLDIGIAKLKAAGFGELAPFAYSMLTNVAVASIAGRDRQSPKEQRWRHDMEAMLERLAPLAQHSGGMECLISGFLAPLTASETSQQVSDRYFALIMTALIEGIERTMLPHPEATMSPGRAIPMSETATGDATPSGDSGHIRDGIQARSSSACERGCKNA